MKRETEYIKEILDSASYGTLALSDDGMPYAVPVNFIRIGEDIYFHGALKNRKMKILEKNPNVSFSVVREYALIASYMSSTDNLACPATQFFASVSIDGEAAVVEDRVRKAEVLQALMEKLQPEGGYRALSEEVYGKAIKATAIVRITPVKISLKQKFGQKLPQERWDMIVDHLTQRGEPVDIETIKMMKELR